MNLDAILAQAHAVAAMMNDAGAMRWLFPLLTVVGPIVSGYYGVQGVWKRRTRWWGRVNGRLQGGDLTGTPALVAGVFHLLTGAILLAIMGPVSAAMLGLW